MLHHIKQLQLIVEGEKDSKSTGGDPSSLDVIFANLLALVQTKRQYSDVRHHHRSLPLLAPSIDRLTF